MDNIINNDVVGKDAKFILELLHKNKFDAYLVGGYVRNIIMGIDPSDIDITTNATPEEIKEIFHLYQVIETGIKHGTVTIIINKNPIEITTYRSDGKYNDNRHPETISFCTNLKDDLSRRDFTINALCYDLKNIVDEYHGIDDINNKIIRAIGNPIKRFNEDSLRILRALRFASRFGFQIEDNTRKAIHELKHLILNVSAERIFSELKKILCGEFIKSVFIEYFDVFETILPELQGMNGFNQHNFHHKYDIMTHTAVVIENTPTEPILRLAALFHDCGKVDTFTLTDDGIGHFYGHSSISARKSKEALIRLKSDNFAITRIVKLVTLHDTPIYNNKSNIKRKLNKYGEEILRKLIILQKADTLGLADEFHDRLIEFNNLEILIDEVIADNECFSLKDLDIKGGDLLSLGLKGKNIGDMLNLLLTLVIEEKIINNKTELIAKAEEIKNEDIRFLL